MTGRQGEWSLVGDATRQRVREAIVPVARTLARLGVSADGLTIAGFLVCLAAALLAALGAWLPAGIVFAFGALFDLFDGAVARVRGTVSPLGGFLDSTYDRLGEGAVYLGVIAGVLGPNATGVTFPIATAMDPPRTVVLIAAIALATSQMVSYTRARAQGIGLDAAVGVAPRPERIALLAAGLVLQSFVPWALGVALALIGVLSFVTILQRVHHVRRLAARGG